MGEIYTADVQITQGTVWRIHSSNAFQGITPGVVCVKRILTWCEVPTECADKYYLLEYTPEYRDEVWIEYFYMKNGNDDDIPEHELYLPIELFVNHTTIL